MWRREQPSHRRPGIDYVSQEPNRFEKLSIAQVRRGSQSQEVTAVVCPHASRTQAETELPGSRRSNREKSRATLVGHRLDLRHGWIDIERFERRLQ
jgi:hypothetical protein